MTVSQRVGGHGFHHKKRSPTAFVLLLAVLASGAAARSAPPVDRFGDPLPPGARMRLGTTRLHGWADHMGLSPDGKRLVVVQDGLLVHTYDAATLELLSTVAFPEEKRDTFLIDTARNGSVQVSARHIRSGKDQSPTGTELTVWDLATGRLVRRISSACACQGVLTPDGKTLLVLETGETLPRPGGDERAGTLREWDLATGRSRVLVTGVYFGWANRPLSPDGKSLILCRTVPAVDTVCFDVPGRRMRWSTGVSHLGAFTPDGKRVLLGPPIEGPLAGAPEWSVLDAATGRLVAGLKPPKIASPAEIGFQAPALAPDGRTLLLPQSGQVRVWDLEAGKEVHVWKLLPHRATAIGPFSADGKRVFVTDGAIHCFELASGKRVGPNPRDWGHAEFIMWVGFTPDGKRLVSVGGNDGMCVWDLADGTLRNWFSQDGLGVAPVLARDGRSAWWSDAQGRVTGKDLDTGKTIGRVKVRLTEPPAPPPPAPPVAAVPAPAAAGLADEPAVRQFALAILGWPMRPLWVSMGMVAEAVVMASAPAAPPAAPALPVVPAGAWSLPAVPGPVTFTPDGQLVHLDPRGRVTTGHDLATGKEVWRTPLTPHPEQAMSVGGEVLSPDGRFFREPHSERLTDARTGRPRADLERRPNESVSWPTALSADGRLMAGYLVVPNKASEPDGVLLPDSSAPVKVTAVAVWETATGRCAIRREATSQCRDSLAFSPDGRSLIVVLADGLAVWDLLRNDWSVAVRAPADDLCWPASGAVAVSPDGRTAAVGRSDGTVVLWPLPARPQQPPPLSNAELDRTWESLQQPGGYRAVWELSARPEQAMRLLAERLKGPAGPAEVEVRRLIESLDAVEYDEREKASRRLERLGPVAEPIIRTAAESRSPETRRRAREILASFEKAPTPLAPEVVRAVRAVAVLDAVSTEEARRLLRGLTSGATHPAVAAAARDALALAAAARRPPKKD
jgi:WD40 repeat protein